MRIGLISDIHGNFTALEAVLVDMNRQPVDSLICMGDVATMGPQPMEVLEKLMSIDCTFIMGNHDAALLDLTKMQDLQIGYHLSSTVEWCEKQMNPRQKDFLRSFKATAEVSAEGKRLLCYHGSPLSNVHQVLATTSPEKLDEFFSGHEADLFIGGHTHVQMMRQYNGNLVINPGSVGTPFRTAYTPGITPVIMPWAEYAVLDFEDGLMGVTTRRVFYDISAFRETVTKSSMPLPELWF